MNSRWRSDSSKGSELVAINYSNFGTGVKNNYEHPVKPLSKAEEELEFSQIHTVALL